MDVAVVLNFISINRNKKRANATGASIAPL